MPVVSCSGGASVHADFNRMLLLLLLLVSLSPVFSVSSLLAALLPSFLLSLSLPCSSSDSVLLLDVGLAAALAVVGGGRGRDLGGVQVGVHGGLVLLEEALEEVVVDERGAVPAGVAQVHQEGQLEGVVERDPKGKGRKRERVVSDKASFGKKRNETTSPFPLPSSPLPYQ